ncbi:RNA 3'-terminal phosphate cyclase [Pelomyxa schiedti]|nr:RNA 3'-terminal phosphate cyclase [Pelomyxa schiedti]
MSATNTTDKSITDLTRILQSAAQQQHTQPQPHNNNQRGGGGGDRGRGRANANANASANATARGGATTQAASARGRGKSQQTPISATAAARSTGSTKSTASAASASSSTATSTCGEMSPFVAGAAEKVLGGSKGSAAFMGRSSDIGWNDAQATRSMAFSADKMTVSQTTDDWGGVVGLELFSTGIHTFVVRASDPIDDAYWIGVAYSDVWVDESPKHNTKCIIWSGGSVQSNRPGTLRVHGEKMRNQPQYSDGDIIGVSVDLGSGDLQFFLNGTSVISWRGVLRGPVFPFVSMKHTGPKATILQSFIPVIEPVRETTSATTSVTTSTSASERDVVSSGVPPLPLVDGSILEGGGQVLRVALAFGALLGRPLHIHSIRAGRPKPGLGHQHSTGAKLVTDLCDGLVRPEPIQYGGHCEGAGELFLWPGVKGLRGGAFHADTHTAGAITLLLQAALPCALLGAHEQPVTMTLRGGTNVVGSPPIDYIRMVLFPLLHRFFGVPEQNLKLNIHKRGFYPWGKGEVEVCITPVIGGISAATITDRGVPISVRGVAYGGGTCRTRLPRSVISIVRAMIHDRFGIEDITIIPAPEDDGSAEDDTAAKQARKNKAKQVRTETPGSAEETGGLTFKERRALNEEARKKTSGVAGVQLVLETSTGCLIAADSLFESKTEISPQEVAEKAVKRLVEIYNAGGCVCEYTMDQLVIFMALARGTSRILCPYKTSISSEHLKTAIHFSELLCGVKFEVPSNLATMSGIIECTGISCGSVPQIDSATPSESH